MAQLNIPPDLQDAMIWIVAGTTACVGMIFPIAMLIVLNLPIMKRLLPHDS